MARKDYPLGVPVSRDASVTFDASAADTAARSVPVSLSSETPVMHFGIREVLSHAPGAVDLRRAAPLGLPFLFNHKPDQLLGRVRELSIGTDRRLRGVAYFADTVDAKEKFDLVRAGMLGEASITYMPLEIEPGEDGESVLVTKWEPYEAGLVTVPRDPTVGANRSMHGTGGNSMTTEASAGAPGGAGTVPANYEAAHAAGRQVGEQAGRQAERQRLAEIDALISRYAPDHEAAVRLRQAAIADNWTPEQALRRLLDERSATSSRAAPVSGDASEPGPQRRATVAAGEDQADKLHTAARAYLYSRSGLERSAENDAIVAQSEVSGAPLYELARLYLRAHNQPTSGDRKAIVGRALISRAAGAMGASDFPSLLADVSNKSALVGFEQAGETWQLWTRPGSLDDFRAAKRVGISSWSDLLEIATDGEIRGGAVGDVGEQIQLRSFGRIYNITRRAIVNDDLGLLLDGPRGIGLAAARVPGDLAYAVLTSNPVMLETGTVLFHADHDNVAASGAAPSTNTVEAGYAAMAVQTGPAPSATETGAVLNLAPRFLLCPHAIAGTARAVRAAQFNTDSDPTKGLPNTVRDRFEVVADARLDAHDAAQWYLAVDPARGDSVEVAGLGGPPRPMIEQETPWSVDGVSFKVTLDAAAAAVGYRGLYRNAGD